MNDGPLNEETQTNDFRRLQLMASGIRYDSRRKVVENAAEKRNDLATVSIFLHIL